MEDFEFLEQYGVTAFDNDSYCTDCVNVIGEISIQPDEPEASAPIVENQPPKRRKWGVIIVSVIAAIAVAGTSYIIYKKYR